MCMNVLYVSISTYILDGKRCAITVQQSHKNNKRNNNSSSSSIWQPLLLVFWSRSGFCFACFHRQNIYLCLYGYTTDGYYYTQCCLLKNALKRNCFVWTESKRNYKSLTNGRVSLYKNNINMRELNCTQPQLFNSAVNPSIKFNVIYYVCYHHLYHRSTFSV